MAVTYIPTKSGQGYVVLCLAADVKPTSTTPASLIETDTGILYYPNGGGGWTAVSGGITQLTGDIAAGPGSGSQAATLPNIVSASTNTKITFNAKGQVTAAAAASLASADFANQGTATTVLHGNAAGNPAFGSVVESDITLANNTTNDVSTSKHGFTPILPNDATKYLNGTGAYSVPSGSSTSVVVQVVNTQTGTQATGTTTIPLDDTIPQNTEGDEYMTLAVTPTDSSNKLRIDVVFFGSCNGAGELAVALFQDSTANALACNSMTILTGTARGVVVISHYMTAGTTSATTFKVRAGSNAGQTVTFNGLSGGRLYGGVAASSITITEIVP